MKKRRDKEDDDIDSRTGNGSNNDDDDDIDIDIDSAESSKQKKKKKTKLSDNRVIVTRPKGVNDALNDFKASFGVSSTTTAASSSSPVQKKQQKNEDHHIAQVPTSSTSKARSTPLLNRHALSFKNSFGDSAGSSKQGSSSSSTSSSFRGNNATTNSTSSSSKDNNPKSNKAGNHNLDIQQPHRTPIKSIIKSHPGSSFLNSGVASLTSSTTNSKTRYRQDDDDDELGARAESTTRKPQDDTISTAKHKGKGKGRATTIVDVGEFEGTPEDLAHGLYGAEEEAGAKREIEQESTAMQDNDQEGNNGSIISERKADPISSKESTSTSSSKSKRATSISSLTDLSARKHLKLLNVSTPSRPSPLRYDTTLNNSDIYVKPLKSLGVISGFNVASNQVTAAASNEGEHDQQRQREGTGLSERKPRWAQLLESSTGSMLGPNAEGAEGASSSSATATTAQDLTELLSPRKKRKGWVPAGHAELASAIIKRLQTASNLWIHEFSRTLATFNKHSTSLHQQTKVKSEQDGSTSSSKSTTSTTGYKSYEKLLADLNPHLRLVILDIYSSKPASLTWSSSEGGFITAGAAEKLLITRCRILKDTEEEDGEGLEKQPVFGQAVSNNSNNSSSPTTASQKTRSLGELNQHEDLVSARGIVLNQAPTGNASLSSPSVDWTEDQVEGLVIFSLAGHSRTSTGVTLVRKEQRRPTRSAEDDNDAVNNAHRKQAEPNQPYLKFKQEETTHTIFVPASISDLHTQMRIDDEIWVWEPWSVVDLLGQDITSNISSLLSSSSKAPVEAEHPEVGPESITVNEKALLISRFGILV